MSKKKHTGLPIGPCHLLQVPIGAAFRIPNGDGGQWYIVTGRIGTDEPMVLTRKLEHPPTSEQWRDGMGRMEGIRFDREVTDVQWPLRQAPLIGSTVDPLSRR